MEAEKSSAPQRALVAMSAAVPLEVIADRNDGPLRSARSCGPPRRSDGPPRSARSRGPSPTEVPVAIVTDWPSPYTGDTSSPPTRAPSPQDTQVRDLAPQGTRAHQALREKYEAILEELEHTKQRLTNVLREKSEAETREADAVKEKLSLQEKLEQLETPEDVRRDNEEVQKFRDQAHRDMENVKSQRWHLKQETLRYVEEVQDRYALCYTDQTVMDSCVLYAKDLDVLPTRLACEVVTEVSGPGESTLSRWKASPDLVAQAEKMSEMEEQAEKIFEVEEQAEKNFEVEEEACAFRRGSICSTRASTSYADSFEEQLSEEALPPAPKRPPSIRRSRPCVGGC